MTFPTRDSIAWTLIIIGGAFGYLATMPAPLDWTWAQWMQTLATITMTAAGKLAVSPLKGDPYQGPDRREGGS